MSFFIAKTFGQILVKVFSALILYGMFFLIEAIREKYESCEPVIV